MTTSEWPAATSRVERAQQLRDVVEVQARSSARRTGTASPPWRRRRLRSRDGGVGEMAGELQPLRLAAGQRRHRLAERQVLEPDVDERLQARSHVASPAKNAERLGDRHLEHVGDADARLRARDLHLEHFGAIAPAVAVGAAQVDVGQELHLDVLEAVAAARRGSARCRS